MAAIIEVCDYGGPYAGNYIPTLLAVGDAVRGRLGMDYVLVFSEVARGRPWLELVAARGFEPRFIDGPRSMAGDARALRRIARETNPRLIRSHFTRFDLSAGAVARSAGARSVWNVHTVLLSHGVRRRVSDAVKVRALGRALCDRVIAVSDEIGRECLMRGHPADRVTVVSNGIDTSRFDVMPGRAEARRAFGISPDERVALGFCWMPTLKGADLIIDACARIGARALLVGEGELRSFVSPAPPHVTVVSPQQDPRSLYAAADVFVSASRAEAFSFAIGEAMAARLPLASSRIPGPAAYFDAPGLETFPSGDASALAEVLAELLDPARRAERGAGNRIYVEERLGLERHVDGVLAVFERELAALKR
jgi:glycosyltransferase involved in cell wall biosynthesis